MLNYYRECIDLKMRIDYENKTCKVTDADGVIIVYDLFTWDILSKTTESYSNGKTYQYVFYPDGVLMSVKFFKTTDI